MRFSEVDPSCLRYAGDPNRQVGLRSLLLVCSTTSTPAVVAQAFITITSPSLFLQKENGVINTVECFSCVQIYIAETVRPRLRPLKGTY